MSNRLAKVPKILTDFNVKYASSADPHWRGRENYPEPKFVLLSPVTSMMEMLGKTKDPILCSFELIKIGFFQSEGEPIVLTLEGVIDEEIGAPRELYAKMSLPDDDDTRLESISMGYSRFFSDHRKIIGERRDAVGNKKRVLEEILSHF